MLTVFIEQSFDESCLDVELSRDFEIKNMIQETRENINEETLCTILTNRGRQNQYMLESFSQGL